MVNDWDRPWKGIWSPNCRNTLEIALEGLHKTNENLIQDILFPHWDSKRQLQNSSLKFYNHIKCFMVVV